jgi:hypothetical protein
VPAKYVEGSPESPALVATDEAIPRPPTPPNNDGQVGLDSEEEEEQQEGDCWQALLLVAVRVVVVAVAAPHLASPLDLEEELLLEAGLLDQARLEEEV